MYLPVLAATLASDVRALSIRTMNWLGKVFVVLILIMSLMFMALAMVVYATHKNWREVIEGPNGLNNRLTAKNGKRTALKAQMLRRDEELDSRNRRR